MAVGGCECEIRGVSSALKDITWIGHKRPEVWKVGTLRTGYMGVVTKVNTSRETAADSAVHSQ